MEQQNELIKLLEEKIHKIDSFLSNISIENEDIIEKNKSIIENNVTNNNLDYLKEIDIEELTKILSEEFNNDLIELKFYIDILKKTTRYRNIILEQQEPLRKIKDILKKISDDLNNQLEKNNSNKKNKEESEKTINRLTSLSEKLSSTERSFEENDISTIFEIIDEVDDKNKALDLLISFGNYVLTEQNINSEEESEIFVENNDQEAVKEKLITIFARHNLDFYWLIKRDQNSLVRYSNPEKVDSILDVFDKYNINLGADCSNGINGILLQAKSLAITEILLHSKPELINKILELAKTSKILKDEVTNKIDIEFLLKKPGIFIKKKKRSFRRGTFYTGPERDSSPEPEEIKSTGCYEDFIKNFNFFTELGISPQEFWKHKKIPETTHQKVQNSKKIFELYGIPKKYYTRSISCFGIKQPADTIDQYIELGFFHYYIDNMSINNLGPNDINCYRLYFALKYTNLDPALFFKDKEEEKNGRKKVLNNKYLNLSESIRNMTPANCYTMVKAHVPFSERDNTNELYSKFEEAISKNDNSDVDIALGRKDSIIALLDDKYLVRDENNNPIFPEIYNFGTVEVRLKEPNNLTKDWDIIISRKKVLRIYNTLMQQGIEDSMESIIYSITRNSILTREEYDIICNSVSELVKGRDR